MGEVKHAGFGGSQTDWRKVNHILTKHHGDTTSNRSLEFQKNQEKCADTRMGSSFLVVLSLHFLKNTVGHRFRRCLLCSGQWAKNTSPSDAVIHKHVEITSLTMCFSTDCHQATMCEDDHGQDLCWTTCGKDNKRPYMKPTMYNPYTVLGTPRELPQPQPAAAAAAAAARYSQPDFLSSI